ncbi:MAG: hypothetical protein PHV20_06245 [Bacteroidales bacterium]|nr:hypothetical protein [Bacteroidales bacterium]
MKTLLTIVAFFFVTLIFAQTVIVSDDPSYTAGATSAVLDVKSTNKGFLLPRVADTTAVSSPTAGLMIYDTTNKKVWLYYNNQWNTFLNNGSGSNGITINADGTFILNGSATTWDDLRVSPDAVKAGANVTPLWADFANNIQLWHFENAKIQSVTFLVQMPHNWKEGTTIYPHVHWAPQVTGTGNVEWQFEYTWANLGTIFGSPITIVSSTSLAFLGGPEAKKVLITPFPSTGVGIDATGKTLSSMMVCRLTRNGTATNDTYAGDAAFLGFDFHFEINSFGSSQEYIK